jgi:hypothetical protein
VRVLHTNEEYVDILQGCFRGLHVGHIIHTNKSHRPSMRVLHTNEEYVDILQGCFLPLTRMS